MTAEELIQAIQVFGRHLDECTKSPSVVLRNFLIGKRDIPTCTCGLDKVLQQLGLPNTDSPFNQKDGNIAIPSDELEKMVQLPQFIKRFHRCLKCRKNTSVELVEIIQDQLVARYQCICGTEYAETHCNRAVDIYKTYKQIKRVPDIIV